MHYTYVMSTPIARVLQKYLPIGLSAVILAVIAFSVPWGEVWDKLSDFPIPALVALTVIGFGYYVGKGLRFWVMLRQLGVRKPFGSILLLYLAGQPLSIMPAGEIYRTALLQKQYGISISRTSPTVLMQGVVEGIVVLSVALVSTFLLGKYRLVVLAVALMLAFGVWVLKGTNQSGKIVSKLPFVHLSRQKIQKFTEDNKMFLSRDKLPQLLLLSLIPELCGIAIVYIAASGLDLHLTLVQSAIAYSVPLAISAVSFLPGGLGASEGSTLGIIKLFGATTATATAVTLIIRVFTLGIGVAMGFVALLFLPKSASKS